MMAVDISLISVPKIFPLFLIIVTLSVSSSYGNLDVPCLESEKHALLSFKKGLADPSNRLSSWDVEADCCKWAGVVCDNLTGHVRELHLQNPYVKQKLGGEVNPSLLNLKHLNYLDLSRNDFGGIPIPTFLGSLTSLGYLNLSEAGFAGTVPHHLGNLSSLRSLGLKGPSPYGDVKLDVENLDWLSRLSTLEYLDLSQVKLNKTPNWLQVINKLPSLVELRLSHCELDYMPPLEKVNFTSLAVLDLSGNEFHALIPRWIFSLSSLVSLNLAESNFEGSLPDMFWNLTSLRMFDVSFNYLNSTLPNSLLSVNSLVSLSLGSGGFEGPIPSGLQNLTSLITLDLSGNFDFNSSIPNWIYSFRYLEVLNLRSTLLHGTLSSSIENLTSLVSLDLSDIELRGRVPREMGNLCNLRTLLMSYSKVEGDISELFESLSGCNSYTLVSLQCDGCQLSGHLTNQLEQFKSLKVLHLGGEIPDCWQNWPNLKVIKLGNNHLSGNIPSSLGFLPRLESLHLRNNSLSGEVPLGLENCTQLVTMDLGLNLIVGSFPTWLGRSLSNLKILSLRSNYFQGQIPSELCHLSSLQILDLANNSFSGPIPQCLKNLTAMVMKQDSSDQIFYSFYMGEFLENAFVVTKGREFQYNTILALLTSMDLSDNNISGEIPEEITSLLGLFSLNLSGNHLMGVIPKEIGNMESLESLDLSRNQLSGELPQSMSDLTFLSHLNVSYNTLRGRIPSSTQLQSLSASSFTGNGLCGPPLTQNCSTNEAPPEGDDEEGVKSDIEWFYLTAAFGFVIGFWIIVGPLLFKKSWRDTYFLFLDEVWKRIGNCLGRSF
ncbi:hypothetical protein RHGRI_008510 [Rhododendron griersonianum]|uniref:Leucine-rich repeat-containing N-terminal plant-type domain-containing protein n=1 Tax=Rhododendron griersonianum TaxID=479676 RepID=A0AAV6L1R3_9ERIC|nr:hypothetical protein RHGRI_008510 [Rhododendron griersonianum]